ncbi:integrase core domain-containing protein [Gimesia algae]|uniref:Integrase catalytic domain-containing protein n=1 Tax=Gimesia algae TaxID=2527971 RepID=A0A517VA02_9PLAN|nr:hypothetical protein Pan161_14660 [Gimesia algae]
MRDWLRWVEVKTMSIESCNGKLRVELFNGEIFDTLWEAKVLIECWKRDYNSIRPHSSPGYRAPVPEANRTAIETTEYEAAA